MTVTTSQSSGLSRLFDVPARLVRQISENGVRETIARVIYRWQCSRRERQMGIQTAASIDGRELGNGDDQNLGYQPIPFESFDRAMEHLDLSSGSEVFIDYGCGMGRAVVLAGQLPFRRVIGVELSPELVEIARCNLAVAQAQLVCDSAEIVAGDATEYKLPDDVSVIFMFNPFCGDVLETVLERIHQALVAHPRECCFVYAQPRENDNVLDRCNWLKRRVEVDVPSEPWQRLVIYDVCRQADESQSSANDLKIDSLEDVPR